MTSYARLLALAASLLCAAAAQTQPSPEAILRHAVELHQAGDIPGAIAEYRAYLKQAPKSVMARSNLGAALSKSGQYEAAIVEYRQALELEPRNLPVRVNLGLALLQDRPDPRRRGGTGQGGQAAAFQPAGGLPAGRLRPAPGREQKGHRAALAAGKGVAQRQGAHLSAGHGAHPRQSAGARPAAGRPHPPRRRIRRSPPAARHHENERAGFRRRPGRSQEGRRNSIPQLPDVFSYYGLALLSTGDMAAAATAFRKELESNPNDFVSNLQLGVLLKQDQHYDEAQDRVRAGAARPAGRPRRPLPDGHPGPGERQRRAGLLQTGGAHQGIAPVRGGSRLPGHGLLPAQTQSGRRPGACHGPQAECGESGEPARGQGVMRPAAWGLALALPLLATAAPPAAGDQACAGCHEKVAASFRATPMAKALEPVAQSEILRQHPSLAFQDGGLPMAHRARWRPQRHDRDGQRRNRYRALALGVRTRPGRADLRVRTRRRTSTKAASASTMRSTASISPWARNRARPGISMTRPAAAWMHIDARDCFGCHSTGAVSGGRLHLESIRPGVGCESCHGPADQHVAAVRAGNPAAAKMPKLGRPHRRRDRGTLRTLPPHLVADRPEWSPRRAQRPLPAISPDQQQMLRHRRRADLPAPPATIRTVRWRRPRQATMPSAPPATPRRCTPRRAASPKPTA